MIHVARIGFHGVGPENYDGPENALQAVLQQLEARGAEIVSVAVIRSTRAAERYEAFITYRSDNTPPAPAAPPTDVKKRPGRK